MKTLGYLVNRNFQDPLYKKFRRDVLNRDKRMCQWYGCNNKKRLNVHHIKTWAQCPDLRYNVNNGITLCRGHHDMIKGLEHLYEAVFLKIVASNARR